MPGSWSAAPAPTGLAARFVPYIICGAGDTWPGRAVRPGARSWETPLAGISVTVAGQTAVTYAEGRYSFYGIAPGTYPVAAQLPNGLTAQFGPAIVSNGRGAVVGIAAVPQSGWVVYLPVVVRP